VVALAHVYFEDEPGRRSAAKMLSGDEAHRIAANIAKLPGLPRERLLISEAIAPGRLRQGRPSCCNRKFRKTLTDPRDFFEHIAVA
jgi:hypothetical protein